MVTTEIVLPNPQRYYVRSGRLLGCAGYVPAGTRLRVGQIEMAIYDLHEQEAVSFSYREETGYFLMEEISARGIAVRLRNFSRLRLVSSEWASGNPPRLSPSSRPATPPSLHLVPVLVGSEVA